MTRPERRTPYRTYARTTGRTDGIGPFSGIDRTHHPRGLVNRGAMIVPQTLSVFRHDTMNTAVITLVGDIDLATAPVLRDGLHRCLRDGVRLIDVDLTAVTFCDVTGLNTFLRALIRTEAAGGRLMLHHPSPALARIIALTGSGVLLRGRPGAVAPHRAARVPSPRQEAGPGVAPATPAAPSGAGPVGAGNAARPRRTTIG